MATGDKRPVVMTGDIDKTIAKKLHAAQHAASGSDPITPEMIGAASVQIGGAEPTTPYTLWFNTGAASASVATLLLNEDAAGAAVAAI